MTNDTLSAKQFRHICMLVGIGGLLVIGGVEEAGHESYISAILALVAVIPTIFIYSSIIRVIS